MSKLNDLTGKKFGRLLVIERRANKKGKTYWFCKCDCGNYTTVMATKLASGETKSCGCIRKENTSKMFAKHHLTKKSLHNAWLNMKNRCDNPKFVEYKHYGGKGVTYCNEWRNFENFMFWALSNGYSDKKDANGRNLLSLDRIDTNGNYEPSNCKWSTRIEQARNKTNNKRYDYEGNIYCLSALAEISPVTVDTIRLRLKKGWSVKLAVETPSKTYKGVKRNGKQ